MSIKNAEIFFRYCQSDTEFRKNLYQCKSRQELLCKAEQAGFKFTNTEAASALEGMKMKAFDEGEAAEINELKLWYELQTEGEDENPLSVCTACSLRNSCSNYKKPHPEDTND